MNNTEEITQLTEWVFKKYIKLVNETDEEKNIEYLKIPIESIDGVKLADSDLRIQPTHIDFNLRPINYEYAINHFYFPNIELASYAWSGGKRPDIRFTKREIRYAITKLFVTMQTLRFNVFCGRFEVNTVEELPLKAMLKLSLSGACKPTKTTGECCVCYEPTQTHFTKCGHTICGKCISHLPESKCCNVISCPMCRTHIQTSEEEQEEFERAMEEAHEEH